MIVIIGGGIAGLMAALAAAPAPVLLLNQGGLGSQAASAWSQGGLAAAIGADDSTERHVADTMLAGAGLNDPAAVRRIIGAGPAIVTNLARLGVRFDRDGAGHLACGLEAAHSRPRILHANGDATGAEIMRALSAAVQNTPSITILDAAAGHIFTDESGVTGVLAATASGKLAIPSCQILLATGGIGGLFAASTNPPAAIGAGLMLAIGAGATLRDLEFIQFHPTALDIAAPALPLISEAVRGEGAILVDETGTAFMNGQDLAPRDIVARAVVTHRAAGHRTFLDARNIGARFAARFPAIQQICAAAGIDPAVTPIPVRPAAHYHMGGVAVDEAGRTSVPGLFAAGEVACTGLHGANRLASNSLLEAAVCGRDAGRVMAGMDVQKPSQSLRDIPLAPPPDAAAVRAAMSAHLGVLRDRAGLETAARLFAGLAPHNDVAGLCLRIAQSALARRVSVGAHAMRDDAAILHRAA
jgi:L-aspartate oxidase